MFFSIIISTFNRLTLLESCLVSVQLAINRAKHFPVEVIITDDSNNEDSMKLVQEDFPNFSYIKGEQKGPAANRNNGASKAVGKWLIFFDDDVIVKEDILTKYAELINSTQAEVFEGAIHPSDLTMMKKDMSECPVNINGNCFWSANFCIRADVFRKVNGFDERFTIAAQEDQDIYIRLKKYFIIYFAKDAIVTHPVRIISFKQKVFNIFRGVENWYLLETKHHKQSAKRFLKVSVSLIYSHLRAAFLNMKDLKLKSCLFSIFWIFSGLPFYFLLWVKSLVYKNEAYE
jgi:GT2 family glycosyltransferase